MFNVRNSIFSFVNGRKGTNLSANYYKVNGIILYVGGRKARFKSQTKRCQYFSYSTKRCQYSLRSTMRCQYFSYSTRRCLYFTYLILYLFLIYLIYHELFCLLLFLPQLSFKGHRHLKRSGRV